MAYTITQNCIACNRCYVSCPTSAIKNLNGSYFVDESLCNDCIGFHGTPQCVAVCPSDSACVPTSYWQSWFTYYQRLLQGLKTSQSQLYWDKWFNIYSEKLQTLLATK